MEQQGIPGSIVALISVVIAAVTIVISVILHAVLTTYSVLINHPDIVA